MLMHEFNRRIHVLNRERERKGKARLLALHRLELHIRAPDREFTEGNQWPLERDREKRMTPSQKP